MKSLGVIFLLPGMLLVAPLRAESAAPAHGSRPVEPEHALSVPEPAAALLGALGVLILLRRRRVN